VTPGYLVRPTADRDIDDIADGLAERAGVETGVRFIDSVFASFELISSQPAIGWRNRSPRSLFEKLEPCVSKNHSKSI